MNMNALPLVGSIPPAESPALAATIADFFAAMYRRGIASQPPYVVNHDYGLALG
jgi:hypothetical protein